MQKKDLQDLCTLCGRVEGRRANEVLDDFLALCIASLRPFGAGEAACKEVLARYAHASQATLWQMFEVLCGIYTQSNRAGEWCDPLGALYEELASKGTRSDFGQFFTPPAVCDLMAITNVPAGAAGKTISDPTCGSGRLLLATHNIAPDNLFFGSDLDITCAKMCAINMAMHGMTGEVAWKNALILTDCKRVYSIKRFMGLPAVHEIEPQASLAFAPLVC
jgi:type I restriction enzyme M protein